MERTVALLFPLHVHNVRTLSRLELIEAEINREERLRRHSISSSSATSPSSRSSSETSLEVSSHIKTPPLKPGTPPQHTQGLGSDIAATTSLVRQRLSVEFLEKLRRIPNSRIDLLPIPKRSSSSRPDYHNFSKRTSKTIDVVRTIVRARRHPQNQNQLLKRRRQLISYLLPPSSRASTKLTNPTINSFSLKQPPKQMQNSRGVSSAHSSRGPSVLLNDGVLTAMVKTKKRGSFLTARGRCEAILAALSKQQHQSDRKSSYSTPDAAQATPSTTTAAAISPAGHSVRSGSGGLVAAAHDSVVAATRKLQGRRHHLKGCSSSSGVHINRSRFSFSKPKTNDASGNNGGSVTNCSRTTTPAASSSSSSSSSSSNSSSIVSVSDAVSDALPKMGQVGLDGKMIKNKGNKPSYGSPEGAPVDTDDDVQTPFAVSLLSRRKREREQVASPQRLSKRRNIKNLFLSLAAKAKAASSSSLGTAVRHRNRNASNIFGFGDQEDALSCVLDNKWSGVPQSLKDKIVKEEALFKAAESRLKARLLRLNEGKM